MCILYIPRPSKGHVFFMHVLCIEFHRWTEVWMLPHIVCRQPRAALVRFWSLFTCRGCILYLHYSYYGSGYLEVHPWLIIHIELIWARVKISYERLQLRSAITTQNMWFTVCSDRGPYVAIPLFRLCLWLKLPVGRMTFQSFDVRVRHWSSRSGLVFLGSCKMACRQVYMR